MIVPRGIAVLGWGSLLWDGGDTFDRSHGPWSFDGPSLRLEFSRVSVSRQGALTLVIDPEGGTQVQVAWCRSRCASLAETVDVLRAREKTTDRNIGRYAADGEEVSNDTHTLDAIRTWAKEQEFEAVVWTDLRSNFRSTLQQPFSVQAALRYLDGLQPDARLKAIEYLRRAPAFVHTPVRDAVESSMAPSAQPIDA